MKIRLTTSDCDVVIGCQPESSWKDKIASLDFLLAEVIENPQYDAILQNRAQIDGILGFVIHAMDSERGDTSITVLRKSSEVINSILERVRSFQETICMDDRQDLENPELNNMPRSFLSISVAIQAMKMCFSKVSE